jgi:hypothetical protein
LPGRPAVEGILAGVSQPPPNERPPLAERWEGLESWQHAVIAFPALAVIIAIVHLTILSQPLGRGIGYGLFWAVPATVLVVVATANERRKRRRRAEAEVPPEDA